MTLKKLSIILFPIYLLACNRQTTDDKEETIVTLADVSTIPTMKEVEYLEHIDSNDLSCLRDIKRAEEDVRNGKIAFCSTESSLNNNLIMTICKRYNLSFSEIRHPCVQMEGHTYNCYELYMDKVIAEKFGKDFKENILTKTDSIFNSKVK